MVIFWFCNVWRMKLLTTQLPWAYSKQLNCPLVFNVNWWWLPSVNSHSPDILEWPCLFSWTKYGNILILQRLKDEIADHTAVVHVHMAAIKLSTCFQCKLMMAAICKYSHSPDILEWPRLFSWTKYRNILILHVWRMKLLTTWLSFMCIWQQLNCPPVFNVNSWWLPSVNYHSPDILEWPRLFSWTKYRNILILQRL